MRFNGGFKLEKNKFQIKREITYAKLIEAGFSLFCEKGYSSASIDEIVSRAGYTKGAFYVHFESKEQFFLDLIAFRKESRADLLPKFYSVVEMDKTLEEIVHTLISGLVSHVKQTPEWILVYVDFFNQIKHNEETLHVYKTYYDSWVGAIQHLIDLLKDKNLISSEVNTLEKAQVFYAYLDGCLLHYNFYGELSEKVIAKTFLSILNSPY